MEIENLVQETVSAFSGQKSAMPHGLLKSSDAEKIDNFITQKMRLRMIWGASLYANLNLGGVGRVSWIDYFRNRWAYQQGSLIALENVENAADFQNIGTIFLGDQQKCFSDSWNNNLYLSNGCQNKFIEYAPQFRGYPFTALMNLGIIPPGNGARFAASSPTLVFTQINALGTPQIPYANSQWSDAGGVGINACTYDNGPNGDGNGATLTANANGRFLMDGGVPVVGDRVLVTTQGSSNGIYTITTLGNGAAPWVLTRAIDYNTSGNIQTGGITTLDSGNVNAGLTFQGTFVGPLTVGTTTITFASVTFKPSPVGIGKQFGYVITWWDAKRRTESLPWGAFVGEDGFWNSAAFAFAANDASISPPSGNAGALTFQGFNFRINVKQLKDAGYDADRVTHFIVYRWTQADVHTMKRIADPDDPNAEASLRIVNDSIDDVTPEADLGKVLDESLSPPPSGQYYLGTGVREDPNDRGGYGPRFVKYFRGQLWLFGISYPGTANGVQIGSDGQTAVKIPYAPQSGWAYASQAGNFDYWQFSYDIGRSLQQEDTGLAIHRGTLMFFKERSAYYLSGTDTTNYVIVPLDIVRGIVAPGSIQETTKGVIGLSLDCFSLFDSTLGGKPISDEIYDEVSSIDLSKAELITSKFDPIEEKYECHVPVENTYNTKVFIYDLKTGVWSFTKRAGGATCSAVSSSRKVVELLGGAQTGRVYRTENQALTTIDGKRIFASWRSKRFDFGSPSKLKSLQRIIISARAVRDFKLSIDVIPDMSQGDCLTIDDISPDAHNDDWASGADDADAAPWDQSRWDATATRKKFTILAQCIGRNLQLIVRNSETDAGSAGFEIEEIVLEASLMDGSNDE